MPPPVADVAIPAPALPPAGKVPIPRYLEQVYWWAYVHPNAVQVFERDWLVNLILFGNYGRLRDAALAELGKPVDGRTLQVACAYGNLTPRLVDRLAPDASLDVVDILPIQLLNLGKKLPADDRVVLLQGDSSSLACPDASYDQVLLFFLLHEQPEGVRRATLSEAMRVVRPGGRVVIVDYHLPVPWHPLRLLMTGVFRKLEPYAMDLWNNEVETFLPQHAKPVSIAKKTYFGGLYQKLVLIR
ncbi:MAG TPA: rhodoquinone biosynthesis methyltransferase RquA [Ramlibacter sp.]|nr:rhodoquinone biosynthesis methyltransferase RquA [Ramlibacter sp.]